jgi:hypothetical protein
MAPLHHRQPRSQRVPIMRPCPYEMSRFPDEKSVVLSQGDALAVNISTRGILLLMPQVPDLKQVFDIRLPIAVNRVGPPTVVETCWTRQVSIYSVPLPHVTKNKPLIFSSPFTTSRCAIL